MTILKILFISIQASVTFVYFFIMCGGLKIYFENKKILKEHVRENFYIIKKYFLPTYNAENKIFKEYLRQASISDLKEALLLNEMQSDDKKLKAIIKALKNKLKKRR